MYYYITLSPFRNVFLTKLSLFRHILKNSCQITRLQKL